MAQIYKRTAETLNARTTREMLHVLHESCHTYTCVISHVYMSHVAHIHSRHDFVESESRLKLRVMAHIYKRTAEAFEAQRGKCYTCHMSHVTLSDESCHTYT